MISFSARLVLKQLRAHPVRTIDEIVELPALASMPRETIEPAIDELIAAGALTDSAGPRGSLRTGANL
ncbi:MAG TPA: hypothetical protein VD790_11355 [Thermoleophilaceae bacterium]|nr:hypothetical protein [Thermoleophilaceae bacterium]